MPSKAERCEKLLRAIKALPPMEARLMEVCGTHTMAIAKAGIKSLLPKGVELVSGPGCPVCVTPAALIDSVLELSMNENIVVATYGDMLRVPGSTPGDSLQRRRALGARVEIVYSSMDALALARSMPEKEIVFLGVGFETTAPGTAAAVLSAAEEGLKNFSVWSMLKTVEPAVRALIASEGFNISGFLCPGHVASIIGAEGFRFLPEEFSLPAVVAGFEEEDILLGVYLLLKQLADKAPRLQNAYPRAVSDNGNALAKDMLRRCFVRRDDTWRGLGSIPMSGLGLKNELSAYDAEKKFHISPAPEKPSPCRCGEVITGRLSPRGCPLFGRACTPEDPVGPCMVSSEGSCAAAYKYQAVV